MPLDGRLSSKERAKKWPQVRAKLKRQFEAMGITCCEICGSSFALSFAHRLKRRFITTMDELATAALLCQQHHTQIEHSGHERMFETITQIISSRDAR
jgi:putative intracellular protease/amidase